MNAEVDAGPLSNQRSRFRRTPRQPGRPSATAPNPIERIRTNPNRMRWTRLKKP